MGSQGKSTCLSCRVVGPEAQISGWLCELQQLGVTSCRISSGCDWKERGDRRADPGVFMPVAFNGHMQVQGESRSTPCASTKIAQPDGKHDESRCLADAASPFGHHLHHHPQASFHKGSPNERGLCLFFWKMLSFCK